MQWFVLALIAGLMLNVYYPHAMLLSILAVEAIPQYLSAFRRDSQAPAENLRLSNLFFSHLLFAFVLLVSLLPTFITRYFIYGDALESGYYSLRDWLWSSSAFLSVLFSSNHGLITWTPILLFSILGLFLFWRRTSSGSLFWSIILHSFSALAKPRFPLCLFPSLFLLSGMLASCSSGALI